MTLKHTYANIVNELDQKKISSVYLLMGEEPYFIDNLVEKIRSSVISEESEDFDQTILYGNATNIQEILEACARYSIISDRRLVLVKEAQHLSRTIDGLTTYLENPLTTTVLVLAYKYSSLDKRKKVFKLLSKEGIVFESKKLYEHQMQTWILDLCKTHNCSISLEASQIMVDYLGTNLGLIKKEIEKLILGGDRNIDLPLVAKKIGINREFNTFELRKAILSGDMHKLQGIFQFFIRNEKKHPFPLIISSLYSFFTVVQKYHFLSDKMDPSHIATILKVSPFFIQDYIKAAKRYPKQGISDVIALLRDLDVQSKGVESHASYSDLIRILFAKIALIS